MSKILTSIFYCCLAYILFYSGPTFFREPPAVKDFALFAEPFGFLLSQAYIIPALYLLGIFSGLICIVRPKLYIRVVTTILFLLLMSVKYSFGKVSHFEHIWMFSSIYMCALTNSAPLSSFRNLIVVRLMQTTLLSFYFSSGLWKLRELGFSNWGKAVQEHLAYAIAEGNGPGLAVKNLLLNCPEWLATAAFGLVISFQLSTIIPVLKQRYFKYWGFAAVLFHLSTGVVIGIWFVPTVFAVLIILILVEIILELENRQLPTDQVRSL